VLRLTLVLRLTAGLALGIIASRPCSAGTLFLRALNISFLASSSTSLPFGALAIKSTSATCKSSLRISSPPLSPSVNTVTVFALLNSEIDFGTLVPSTAIEFFTPYFRRLSTSALPSTTMIASESPMFGPAGSFSAPNFLISWSLTDCFTSSVSSMVSGVISSTIVSRMFLARSSTFFLLVVRTSSILSTTIDASHGPTRSMVSRADAKIAVSTLSKLEGTLIVPLDFPPFDSILTSIRPILPVFCSSLKSKSFPSNPSVCPKIAPTTSGFSTMPLVSILA